mmetsp:Transcript_4117/g.7543  ORF Transcript_4117/g.7543 Transcript_4117/m.7543 type:complete len:590 (+) Transcript_4117:56-1825(+)
MTLLRAALLWTAALCSSAWPSDWSWTALQVPSAPAARQGHAAVEVGRKIYVIGGCHQEIRCYNDVHVFDTGARRWSQENVTGDFPAARGGHTATLVGSDIFLIGGASSEATFADVYRLDLLRRRWTKVAEGGGLKMSARTSHAAVADAGRIYVFGGYDADGGFLNDLWVLHAPMSPPYSPDAPDVLTEVVAEWSRPVPTGEVPSARQGHSLTLVDRHLILFGGLVADGSNVNDVYSYDIARGSWGQLAIGGTAPAPRQAHSALRHGHSVVVAGGCASAGGAHCFSDVWRLDLSAKRWTQRSAGSAQPWREREGHSAVFVGAQMFVFGGCQVSECFNDVGVLETDEPCPDECGGHGRCVDNLYCQCTEPGFNGHDCLQPLACHEDCGLHGACGQDGRCVCSGGWTGLACASPPGCPGAPLPCSGRGECLPEGTCRCQAGAAGIDCFADASNQSQPISLRTRLENFLLVGSGQQPAASKHARAADPITTSDFGILKSNQDGHAGEDLSPDCDDNCNWRGLCSGGVCYCQPGYSGRTCSIAKENTAGTLDLLTTVGLSGLGFVTSLGTTLSMLGAQKRAKLAKEMEVGYGDF